MSTSPPSVNGRTRDDSGRVVQKLWSYCHVLRDDGLSYQDYLEQLTQLLFLKMSDERAALTGQEQAVPRGFRWADLARPDMEGVRLEDQYLVNEDEFVGCYCAGERHRRKAKERWRAFSLEEILARDKVSLDLTWLRDESLEDSANLPEPQVLAQEIADDLQAALAQMQGILVDLQGRVK